MKFKRNESVKKLTEISLYDMMSEDMDIWIKPNNQFGFDIEINEDGSELHMKEPGIHPCAAESFAVFCRSYLFAYEHALKKKEA